MSCSVTRVWTQSSVISIVHARVIVVCSVLTQCWVPSLFGSSCLLVLTSGTCGTAVLATPLEVVETSRIGASLSLSTIFTLFFVRVIFLEYVLFFTFKKLSKLYFVCSFQFLFFFLHYFWLMLKSKADLQNIKWKVCREPSSDMPPVGRNMRF